MSEHLSVTEGNDHQHRSIDRRRPRGAPCARWRRACGRTTLKQCRKNKQSQETDRNLSTNAHSHQHQSRRELLRCQSNTFILQKDLSLQFRYGRRILVGISNSQCRPIPLHFTPQFSCNSGCVSSLTFATYKQACLNRKN